MGHEKILPGNDSVCMKKRKKTSANMVKHKQLYPQPNGLPRIKPIYLNDARQIALNFLQVYENMKYLTSEHHHHKVRCMNFNLKIYD
jgi:anaerobic ribonucleoside-triphosphate reductase